MGVRSTVRRYRSHDVGLSVVLFLQMLTMFVAAPLAATGVAPPEVVDLLRVGLAAAAVLLVTRTRRSAVIVTLTVAASAALALASRHGLSASAVTLERLAASGTFDAALLIVVARAVFGPGQVSVHRILGAVIVYLSIGLIFGNVYRACAILLAHAFSTLPSHSGGPFGELLYAARRKRNGEGAGAPTHSPETRRR